MAALVLFIAASVLCACAQGLLSLVAPGRFRALAAAD